MAQLLVINLASSKQKPKGVQNIGDLVGVFPDSHQFSPTEQSVFDVVTVHGTVEAVRQRLPITAIKVDPVTEKDIWQDGASWKELKKAPKFEWNISDLTEADKAILANPLSSSASKDAVYVKAINNIRSEDDNLSTTVQP